MQFSTEEKALWLEDWKQSGKSAWTYAKENGLNPQTFSRWIKAGTETKSNFVELTTQVIQPMQYPQEILIEKGDVKIHIPLCIGSKDLHAIFRALAEAV